ncbi:hypothetical protein SELMODRAFT_418612 [Selaginella moellendorffii]|uniref:ENT domain-containing protein n=1 Tax=Selaginella moellendorffii TaxID=88036 RepID=D8S6K9_SELML|nr:hypothetical protein SELMODRAFT_418612 [Selaginella moellendorffii]
MAPRKGVLRRYDSRKLQMKKLQELEQEAYKAVMRAFNAQSDGLSWGRERLMSDLRKELRVSDELHREFLSRMPEDKTVMQIRDCRRAGQEQTGKKRKSNATGVLKRFPKGKKSRVDALKPEEPELLTIDALQHEVGLLEVELDATRLARAKKAAYEYKTKLMDALEQAGQDNEDDSEKTEDRDPVPGTADTQPQSQSQENVNTENTENTECKPGHEDGSRQVFLVFTGLTRNLFPGFFRRVELRKS